MAWVGNDFERPLDDDGRMQAEAIGAALAWRPVRRILSSPYVRCVETAMPLGRALGLPVEACDELAEGSCVNGAFKLLGSLAGAEGDSVLCSHGDVIPGLLWVLAQYGLNMPGMGRCKKGSIWELDVSDGRIVAAAYRHPPHLRRRLTEPSGPSPRLPARYQPATS